MIETPEPNIEAEVPVVVEPNETADASQEAGGFFSLNVVPIVILTLLVAAIVLLSIKFPLRWGISANSITDQEKDGVK